MPFLNDFLNKVDKIKNKIFLYFLQFFMACEIIQVYNMNMSIFEYDNF